MSFDVTDYARRDEDTRPTACRVADILAEALRPRRVVDIGCGIGTWLSVFGERGADGILGIDGPWVDPVWLKIPAACFQAVDLAQPFAVGGSYDLAISLEVAEHIPAERAPSFVATLTALAPFVLFSAAIPLQTGKGHVNEQWPSYWVGLFRDRGYVPIDMFRRHLWREGHPAHYKQNLLLFVQAGIADTHPVISRERKLTFEKQLDLVHPDVYLFKHELLQRRLGAGQPSGGRAALRTLLSAVRRRMRGGRP